MPALIENAAAQELVEAIARLPQGVSLLAEDVSWDDYEKLLEQLASRRPHRARVFYDRGKLEVMSPKKIHERPKAIVHRLLIVLSEELGIEIDSIGSTTLKRAAAIKGAEPYEAFYIMDIEPALGEDDLDLTQDPSPHLVIEIEHTSGSLNKFEIYAALGAPEFWRWGRGLMEFYQLRDGGYEQTAHSRVFPFLSALTLTEFVQQGLREGETKAARAFRLWARANLPR
jgi:Uma2 family endonuclease